MSTSFAVLLPYCSGARDPSSFALLVVSFPNCLLWMFASIFNRSIYLSWWGRKSSGSLCMRRSRPLWYLLGQYPMHQGKLDIHHKISLSYGLRDSVFIVEGVMMEGPGDVPSLRYFNSVMQSSRVMGVAESGRSHVTGFRYSSKVMMCTSSIYYPISSTLRISCPQASMPLQPSLLTIRDDTGRYFSDSLHLFPISSIDAFSYSGIRVIYFLMVHPSSSGTGVSVLSLCTHIPFGLVLKVVSCLDLYLSCLCMYL